MKKCHENFITDINELCNECPIREKINRGRTNTIKECELIKSANTKELYIDYLRNQITKANQVIERIAKRVIKLKEEAYKEKESALFLSWQDCISYYNEQIETFKPHQPKIRIAFNETSEYDVNIWNKESFDLFNYLAENYNATAQKQKFINIWLYLEHNTKDHYVFNFGKDKYKEFITKKFSFDFSKAKINKPNNYENQLTILNNHYTTYCNKLKGDK